jgi:hypothetical protein
MQQDLHTVDGVSGKMPDALDDEALHMVETFQDAGVNGSIRAF